ncbi:MAG TPA: SidA/IucD/PvdA family monooxygenase [Pseudonocardiaceae bacterium]|jgi:L-ornithine N5-oxygenase|nr:SidA/IucD/PvdA family monooxygenase [Pseudonocardiaceae bacterium]
MDHQDVELLVVGAGPSSLAVAIAVEEMAPCDFARAALVVEQHDDIAWQRGMLLPHAQSQVSFLKDLVTLRNPRSRFSFINYLHSVGRLDDFINCGSLLPYRAEISDYLAWVADSLSTVRVQRGRRCTGFEPVTDRDGTQTGWLVRLADGATITARTLVVGAGRDAHIPDVFGALPKERLIHSSQYAMRAGELDPATTRRVVVVGAAQSAAELLSHAHQTLPDAECTMVMRTAGLSYYQTSRFLNELYFPSFTDEFYEARPQAKTALLAEMRTTNYAGVAPDMLDAIYRTMYVERLTARQRMRMVTMVDVVAAKEIDGEVRLTLVERRTGLSRELRCDVVLLGTGFHHGPPSLVRGIADAAGVDEVRVGRNYRMITPPSVTAACYLQGVNEQTHGIADSLISVLAVRAGEIVADVLANRRPANGLADATQPDHRSTQWTSVNSTAAL